MANNFKSDDSFLRKLVIGASGTNATIEKLKGMRFNPIELERGSTGFKIWKKIKIKRVRVPDVLCLDTGIRVESRGKTKLEISMSHSPTDPKRTWDYGMHENDWVSIVQFDQSEDNPTDVKQISPVHFIRVGDMKRSYPEGVSVTKPKGVDEGSEVRLIWKTAVANKISIVSEIDGENLKLTPVNGERRQTIRLIRTINGKTLSLIPSVKKGDRVEENQIVASVVPVYLEIPKQPRVDESYFIERLQSYNLSERYAAAKALRYKGFSSARSVLEKRVKDSVEDIYVQLEAAAALASVECELGWRFIEEKLIDSKDSTPLETQLESIIVISELSAERSEKILVKVLQDTTRCEEIRAGAAWALGQFVSKESASALINTFNLYQEEIKIEAARALLRIAEPQIPFLLDSLKNVTSDKRDGISWVLARVGGFDPVDLIKNEDVNLRHWGSYILGYGKERFSQEDIERICSTDKEVYFAASVLWQILSSWINNLREF